VLTEAVAATTRQRPAAAAVALAHCALIERDRGNIQRAVEHADAARNLIRHSHSRTARAVTSYASGLVEFTVGNYTAARQALTEAEPVLRRRPEGSTSAAVLAQVHAALGEPDESMAAAGRTAAGLVAPGQLPTLIESQLAAGWAQLRAGHAAEAKGLVEDLVQHFEKPFDTDGIERDERTQDLWRRLMGEACLLLALIQLTTDESGAAAASLDRATGHLRPTAAADLLGMTRIYQGQCHRLQGRWTEARASVAAGVELLESRRGQLRAGALRASAVAASTNHYDTALAVLVQAQHHGDAQAGTVAAGLIESLRRNAFASALRDERAASVDRFPFEALKTMEDITRLESTMDVAGRTSDGDITNTIDELRRKLEIEVSRGFAQAYLPERVDFLKLSAVARQAHILQFELLETGQDRWRGYRVWVPPDGMPWTDEVTVTNRRALDLLNAVRRGEQTMLLFQEFDETAEVWAALAEALLPPSMIAELRRRPASAPIRLLIVPGEHLAYLPWAPLLLDKADEDALLLHKAVIQIVPSLDLLQRSGGAMLDGNILAYLDREAVEQIDRGGAYSVPWQRLSSQLPVILVGSRDEFEQYLSDPRIDGIYLAAHGDGTGLAQSINFSVGGKLSAAAALQFRWPRSMVFASCFVAKVEQQTGREPLGLAIACMLGGCRTVIGGVIKVERQATGEISTDTSLALATGTDPATALRDAQRAYIEREGAVFLNEWAGLVCISTEWKSLA
jgi:tetratricopeptide (TPR) repeat protein